ncbi:MAG: acyltransferase [Desulfobacterales bacterium]|nr:acyltransferase [Desulfobacterales bacterium]
MGKKQHIEGFDLLRIFSVAAVIGIHCFHTNQSFKRFGVNFLFAVPCFVMMSIYLSIISYNKHKSGWQFIKKRAYRLIPAFSIWTAIYAIVRWSGKDIYPSVTDCIRFFFFGSVTLHFYFIPMIFYFSVILALLPVKPAFRIPVCLVGLFAATWLRYTDIPVISLGSPEANVFPVYFTKHLPFLFLAVLLFDIIEHTNYLEWINKRLTGVCIICLSGTIVLWLLPRFLQVFVPVQQMGQFTLLFLTFRFWALGVPRWIIPAAIVSFGIYLSHHLFAEGLLKLEAYLELASHSASITLIRYIFCIVISTGFCILFGKIKRFKWLVI